MENSKPKRERGNLISGEQISHCQQQQNHEAYKGTRNMAHLWNENKLMETIPEKLLDLLDKDFETTVLKMVKEQKKKKGLK